MATVTYIADNLGRRMIAARFGVNPTAVSNHVVRGYFPASWFEGLEQMCAEAGIDCPRSAFAFRKACEDMSNGDATVQGLETIKAVDNS